MDLEKRGILAAPHAAAWRAPAVVTALHGIASP